MTGPEKPKFELLPGGGESIDHQEVMRATTHVLGGGNIGRPPDVLLRGYIKDIASSPYVNDGEIYPLTQGLLAMNEFSDDPGLTPEVFVQEHVEEIKKHIDDPANVEQSVRMSMAMIFDGIEHMEEAYSYIAAKPFNKERRGELIRGFQSYMDLAESSNLWKNPALSNKMVESLVISQRLSVMAAEGRGLRPLDFTRAIKNEIVKVAFGFDRSRPLSHEEWEAQEEAISSAIVQAMLQLKKQGVQKQAQDQ